MPVLIRGTLARPSAIPGAHFFGTKNITVEPSIKTYKRQFDRDLRHIKIILSHKRHEMPVKEWLNLVNETKESILISPEEYFCSELPPYPVFCCAIQKVFDGFLEDQRLLALQTSKGFRIPSGK